MKNDTNHLMQLTTTAHSFLSSGRDFNLENKNFKSLIHNSIPSEFHKMAFPRNKTLEILPLEKQLQQISQFQNVKQNSTGNYFIPFISNI